MEFKAELNKIPLKVEDGSYILSFNLGNDPHIAYEIYEQYMKAPVKVKIEKYRGKRSNEANRMFWSCITKLAEALHMSNEEMYLRELKRYGQIVPLLVKAEVLPELRKKWRTTEIISERIDESSGDKYYEINCYTGSSEYNTKQFARLLSGVLEDMRDLGLDTEEEIAQNRNTIEN